MFPASFGSIYQLAKAFFFFLLHIDLKAKEHTLVLLFFKYLQVSDVT
jgi:hypothetical protein